MKSIIAPNFHVLYVVKCMLFISYCFDMDMLM